MPAIVVVGGHWGDEGKGKVIDLLSEQAAMVVRYSGGNNAGHTVVNPLGHFAMHLIPCGIFNPKSVCVIGNGVAFDPAFFLKELQMLGEKAGIDVTDRLFVSDRAHLIMPYHKLVEKLDEQARGADSIGTTLNGIGPVYTDKAARIGLRVGDLLEPEVFKTRLRFVVDQKNLILTRIYGADPLDAAAIYGEYMEYASRIAPFITETGRLVRSALAQNKLVLLEGAQGTLLDLDHGTYPYITSSSPTAGGAALGSGIPPTQITKSLGIFKAYTTRVGAGPFPTELPDDIGNRIRERGHEYGTTTGRARRCGWFDAVAARYSIEVNGLTAIALVRLDVLDIFSSIKICTGYNVDGGISHLFPSSAARLERCTPIYEELPGWETPTSGARNPSDLPANAKAYIRRLEEVLDCPINIVGVGPAREESVCLRPLL